VSAQRRDGVKYGRLARQSENDVRRRIVGAGNVDPPLPIVNMHTQHRCNPAVGSASDRPLIQRLEPFVRGGERRLMFVRVSLSDVHHGADIHQSRASGTIRRTGERSACGAVTWRESAHAVNPTPLDHAISNSSGKHEIRDVINGSGDSSAKGSVRVAVCLHDDRQEGKMLYVLAVILLIAWLLGVVGTYTIGAFVHVLLVIAVVLFIVGLLSGRRTIV